MSVAHGMVLRSRRPRAQSAAGVVQTQGFDDESPSPRASVVVHSRGETARVQRCIAPMVGLPGVEVVVVDGGSFPAVQRWLRGLAAHVGCRLVLLPPDSPGSLYPATVGAQRSRAPVILILNVDAVPGPGLVDEVLGALAADAFARGGGLGSSVVTDLDLSSPGVARAQVRSRVRASGCYAALGAVVAVRREVFGEVGCFGSALDADSEFLDFGIRARGRGWQVIGAPLSVSTPPSVVWARIRRGGAALALGVGDFHGAPVVEVESIPAAVEDVESTPPAVEVVPRGELRVAFYSSARERCGIATYTERLRAVLPPDVVSGHFAADDADPGAPFRDAARWGADVVHVQHEFSFIPDDALLRAVDRLRRGGTPVAATFHTWNMRAAAVLAPQFDAVFTHRAASGLSGAEVLPMPCPIYAGVAPGSRARFSVPDDALVVTTVGFMAPHKKTVEVAELLMPWVLSDPRVHLQLIASQHWNPHLVSFAAQCRAQVAGLAVRSGGRIVHVEYPSDAELLERIAVSDLGYVYCGEDTASSSAAGTEFVAARCPVVTTDSTHYDDLRDLAVRAGRSVEEFAAAIIDTARDPVLLRARAEKMASDYARRNYATFALHHAGVYRSLRGGAQVA